VRLLRDWKRGLEQQRPGLLQRLRREREHAKRVKTNVSWTQLKAKPDCAGAGGGGGDAPFSFGFG
jgi:hypothetical protein